MLVSKRFIAAALAVSLVVDQSALAGKELFERTKPHLNSGQPGGEEVERQAASRRSWTVACIERARARGKEWEEALRNCGVITLE